MRLELHTLAPEKGAVRPRKRLGRGHGSGTHKTSGKGTKGQRARTGHHGFVRPGFEGGQTPMSRRLPKRGFHNHFRKEYSAVNLGQILNKIKEENALIDIARLKEEGLVPRSAALVKILGGLFPGQSLSRGLRIEGHHFSRKAKELLQAHQGEVMQITV